MTAPLLEVAGLTVDLGGRRVIEAAAFVIAPGEVVGIVGRNGSGKTTLLRGALGLARSAAGESKLGGEDVRGLSAAARAARVGYLPQDRVIGWNLPVWRVAALGAPLRPAAQARATAIEAMAKAGVAHLADRKVLDLSGGERAKVLLARLLATQAPLLVADEPIAGLDPAAQLETLAVFRDHARRGGGVLVTLHDLALARRYADRLIVMGEGRVLAAGPAASVLTPDVLGDGFGLTAKGELVEVHR